MEVRINLCSDCPERIVSTDPPNMQVGTAYIAMWRSLLYMPNAKRASTDRSWNSRFHQLTKIDSPRIGRVMYLESLSCITPKLRSMP